ncbi:metallophosphoesterase [Archaeoglobales archaeon]|nr:MAG: metallophosphoesterase [Archaeoglobales archaeon]
MKKTKIFLATDVHGAEITYRKFISAVKIYRPDVAIIAGDLTGKVLVPIVKQQDGTLVAYHMEQKHVAKTKEELDELIKKIRYAGYYPYCVTAEEMEMYKTGKLDAVAKFTELVCEVLKNWTALAEEHLNNVGVKFFMMPGNDDDYAIDEILNANDFIINPADKVMYIDELHEMMSLPYSNITPWNCPRDLPEETLRKKIDELANQVENMGTCIFNIHVPPFRTPLDQAPLLEKDLQQKAQGVQPVGSIAVYEAIEKYQPLLSLHGHIHESRGTVKIGRTLCINPGSEYSEGILHGVLIVIEKEKVNYTFTTG